MKRLLIIAGVLGIAMVVLCDRELDDKWKTFKNRYGKRYKDAKEDALREAIFAANARMIAEHNARYKAGDVPYALSMNKFGDLTDDEYEKMLGFKGDRRKGGRRRNFPND